MQKYVSCLAAFALAVAGFVSSAQALVSVSANITTDTTWGDDAGEDVMLLQQPIFVTSGATLTILPGVLVRGQPRTAAQLPNVIAGTPGALIVSQNGRINAVGSASNPIIFTTAAVDNNGDGVADDEDANNNPDAYPGFVPGSCATTCVPSPTPVFLDATPKTAPLAPIDGAGKANVSLWGGLVLLGNAPNNLADEQGQGYGKRTVEGLTVPGFPVADALYGGVDPHDNSGILKYVSVRHAGDEIGLGNELNGVSLAGVGDATEISYVEVYCNFDDGFEWFGGTVNSDHLVVTFGGDDQFDLDEGFDGINQFLFAVFPFFNNNDGSLWGSKSGDKGCEWDGDDYAENFNVNTRENYDETVSDPTPWPFSGPAVYNLTIIGSSFPGTPDFTPVSPRPNGGKCQMRNGFQGRLLNSIIVNTGSTAPMDVTDGDGGTPGSDTCTDNTPAGLVLVIDSSFAGSSALPMTGCNATALANGGGNFESGFTGLVNSDSSFNPQGVNHVLVPSLKTAKIDPRPAGTVGVDGGAATGPDKSATYRGAFKKSATELWTDGWTALSIAGLL